MRLPGVSAVTCHGSLRNTRIMQDFLLTATEASPRLDSCPVRDHVMQLNCLAQVPSCFWGVMVLLIGPTFDIPRAASSCDQARNPITQSSPHEWNASCNDRQVRFDRAVARSPGVCKVVSRSPEIMAKCYNAQDADNSNSSGEKRSVILAH